MSSQTFPDVLLDSLTWGFTGGRFLESDAFSAKVRSCQLSIQGDDKWESETMLLDSPNVFVRYWAWEGDDQVEMTTELTSSNGSSFTALELLWQLHNAVVEKLSEIDHHFLEGLRLLPDTNDCPCYFLELGS